MDEVLVKLSANGATIVQPKTNVGGTIEMAVIKDPFGNQVGSIEGA